MTTDPMTPGLTWPIKASFVDYVLGMEDGELNASDGATVSADHIFTFEPAGALSFRGDVRFVAHFGMLAVQIANPHIEFGPETAVLTVETGGQRFALATLVMPEPESTDTLLAWHGALPRLTPAGSSLFNGVYPPGHELDPLDIVVAR